MTGTGPESWTPDDLSKEQALTLMSRPRRRHVVHALLEADDGALTREELVNILAAGRQATHPSDIEDDRLRTIDTSLVHLHLPKLDNHDVVEYDRDSGHVELSETASDVLPLLQFADDPE
ncbi:DUF7344 domain-containing protein [Halomarina oriensis]|uniref:DUF7344 domain-containing protein n=1 Tax=Halomarina oriensis TaxID=671145 RepID=A0A6B0GNG7_9EURY|nr:hypothetical protein [Halomarina oriensis]MWG36334.1 hypothetical protein [Halomarina oriensis]